MPAERIGDNDVLEIREAVGAAVRELREDGGGPRFFECMTYRWKADEGPEDDWELGYRSPDEARPWIEDDQVKKLGSFVQAHTRLEIETAVEREIAEAVMFAEAASFPNPEDLDVAHDAETL